MTLIKLAGFSVILTLAFQRTYTLGETFLTENNKEGGLKSPEKRANNFRVPLETPFDPNFWPARGRRSRRDPERDSRPENCIASLDKTGIQCQSPKIYEENSVNRRSQQDFEIIPPTEPDDELLIEKADSNCYGNSKPKSMGRLGVKIPEALRADVWAKGFEEMRHKTRRHSGLPQLILYGNGVYWEPENLYGEKKKKQDIFWVARGKKNLNFL